MVNAFGAQGFAKRIGAHYIGFSLEGVFIRKVLWINKKSKLAK